MRPLLLLDVDGPLNPAARKPHRRPAGYETYRLLTPRWGAAERRRLTGWGLANKSPKPLQVWLNPDHGPELTALPFDLVWATTWKNAPCLHLVPDLRKEAEIQGATTVPRPLSTSDSQRALRALPSAPRRS